MMQTYISKGPAVRFRTGDIMKILIVVPDTNIGGVTTSVYNFSSELEKRGHNITFLDFSAKENNQAINKNIQQIFLKGRAKYWQLGAKQIKSAPIVKRPFLLVLGLLKKLTIKSGVWDKIIFKKLEGEYDVAVAFRQCAPCYSFVLNKVNAKKKIGFVHGDVDFIGDISSWQPLMKSFDKIAYVSDAVKEGFIKKYPELKSNAATVYNMLSTEKITALSKEENPFVFDKKVKNIVTVARIENATKQIDWIPQICKNLLKKCGQQFHWYVIGDGPDLEIDKEMSRKLGLEGVLTFTGAFENPYKILKDADLFVLPTKTESFGLVVAEALILGVPCVVSQYPALFEILKDGEQGLIAQQTVQSVAKKIKQLIENQDLYNAIKKNCENYEGLNALAYEQFEKL